MPVIPPPPVLAPYDYLEGVLYTARNRLNDSIQSLAGDILTDDQPFTGQMVNDAWRKLQAYLANKGYSRVKNQWIGQAYPVTVNTDPSSQASLSWTSYFNGTAFFYAPTVDLLPWDFILPLKMWERITGSNGQFIPMRYAKDGLPDFYKRPLNCWFEWREDAIFMPGATQSLDFRIEYAAYLQDFPVNSENLLVTPATQQVPIMRCRSALANYICAEVAIGRDDLDAGDFMTQAEKDADLIMNVEIKLKQRNPVQRQAYGGRGGSRSRSY